MCGHSLHENRETRQAPSPKAKGKRVVSMKERTRRIDADANRESDGVIVPESPPNKEAPASAEVAERRTSAKRNAREESAARIQSRKVASSGLEGVLLYRSAAPHHPGVVATKLLRAEPQSGAWDRWGHVAGL
jgi:hypothetical protein